MKAIQSPKALSSHEALETCKGTREPLWRVRHLRPRRPPSQLGKPPPVTVKTRSEVPLPLKTSGESSGECGEPSFLAFGDAVRLTLPPLAAGGLAAALCACVRPKAVGDVGPREIVPTDAEREELRLAEDLASSGRRAKDFVAVTAARVPDPEVVVRRSAWRVFRCSELDGFPAGSRVHYGQHLHFGLPSVDDADSEILLSCEPPSRCGGLGAPYLILGRFVDFGHVCQGRRSWNTAFTMVPEDASSSAGGFGDPVDLRCGVRIIPIAPFSYLHGPRLMQASSKVVSNFCAVSTRIEVRSCGLSPNKTYSNSSCAKWVGVPDVHTVGQHLLPGLPAMVRSLAQAGTPKALASGRFRWTEQPCRTGLHLPLRCRGLSERQLPQLRV